MKSIVYRVDEKMNLVVILFLFWGLFWLLNGGDKFFNGEVVPNTESWSAKAVLVDGDGDVSYTFHAMETVGLYGVNRDNRMIQYFAGIHLPAEVAIASLYGIAIFEIILGLAFFSLLGWCLLPDSLKEKGPQFYNDRTVHRLAFKGSILVFVFFAAGDILFGDRVELWEHGTFIVMCLITYDLWYRTDRFFLNRGRNNDTAVKGEYRSIQATTYEDI